MNKIDKITLSKNDLTVSRLGFGLMRLPLKDPNDGTSIDYETGEKMVDAAMAAGVNYYDTAYMYHNGLSEEFIGKALSARYDRESFHLTTKLPIWHCETPEDMQKVFDDQLRKCQVDYFDVYLIHSITSEHWGKIKDFDAIGFIDRLKKSGKVKNVGFSFHDSPEMFREVFDAYDWDIVQIQNNYLDWDAQRAKEMVAMMQARNVPFIVMEPVRGGSLANPIQEVAEVFKAARPEASFASWALRWVGSIPNCIVLSGMSTPEQMAENIDLFTGFEPMSKEEYDAIEKAKEAIATKAMIPCTGCQYCIDCPSTVNIPAIFHHYNEYVKFSDPRELLRRYPKHVEESRRAENCVECGLCMTVCPQHIQIPEMLKKVIAVQKSLA